MRLIKYYEVRRTPFAFMAPRICFLQYAPGVKVGNAWRVLSLNHFSPGRETKLDHSHFGQLKLLFWPPSRSLPDLQKQRDEFALTVSVRLDKDGFQLISRRLPGNLQLPSGNSGRSPARDDAGELGLRRGQVERFGEGGRWWPWPWSQGIQRQKSTHVLPRLMRWPVEGPNAHDDR